MIRFPTIIVILCCVCTSTTNAGVMLSATSVSTDLGTAVGDLDNLINQTGLTVNYVSGTVLHPIHFHRFITLVLPGYG